MGALKDNVWQEDLAAADRCLTYPMAKLSTTFCTKMGDFSDARCSAALRPRGSVKGSLESSRRGLSDGAGRVRLARGAAAPAGKRCVLGTLVQGLLQGRGSNPGGQRRRHGKEKALAHTGTTFVCRWHPSRRSSSPSKSAHYPKSPSPPSSFLPRSLLRRPWT